MPPLIKTHHNRNRYLLSNSYWVRDFTKTIKPEDINRLTQTTDHNLLATNESKNLSLNLPDIGSEKFNHPKILIVSDGYSFQQNKHILESIPKDVIIIGVNRSLANWIKKDNTLLKAKMSYYVINNPYESALGCLPSHNYIPKCIASIRTNHQFLKKYKGFKYVYTPVFDQNFGSTGGIYYQIDDYRNPICAAIGLAYRFNVRKIGFFCCDDAFKDERPASIKLDNGLFIYPQHLISHALIDGNLYWLTHQEDIKVDVINLSNGPDYENAENIDVADKLIAFFSAS